jgi:hypothetical protein
MKTAKKSINLNDYNLKDFILKVNNGKSSSSLTITKYIGKGGHVTIPGYIKDLQIKEIGESAFMDNTMIKKITIEKGVTDIGPCAFMFCSKLTDVELPDNLLCINYLAFKGCKKLAKIRLPETVEFIDNSAFENCKELTSIFIPKKVKYISNYGSSVKYNTSYKCFLGCNKLKEIIVDSKNPEFSSLDGVLFNKAKTILWEYPEGKETTNYTIPDTVIGIKYEAFHNCKKFTAVIFPDKFLSLPNGIFLGCIRLKKVTLSQKTKIEHNAFLGSSVKFVYID